MAAGILPGTYISISLVLWFDDVIYRDGSLFATIGPFYLLSHFITIIITAIVGSGLLFRPGRKKVWLGSVDAFLNTFFIPGSPDILNHT